MPSTPRRSFGNPEPWGRRRRVLVEDPDPGWHRLVASTLGSEEYDFDCCPGPRDLPEGCPLLAGRPCPRAERADVILSSLDLDDDENRSVLQGLRTTYPRTRVVALVSRRQAREHPSCLHGCQVEFLPIPVHDLDRLVGGPPRGRLIGAQW